VIHDINQVLAIDLIGTPQKVALLRTCGRTSGGEQKYNNVYTHSFAHRRLTDRS